MPSRDLLANDAEGIDWVNPANALIEDGAFAVYPPGIPAEWLFLRSWMDRSLPAGSELENLRLRIVTGPTAGSARGGAGELLEWENCPDDARAVVDGNLVTNYGFTVSPGATGGITVCRDLAQAKTISRIQVVAPEVERITLIHSLTGLIGETTFEHSLTFSDIGSSTWELSLGSPVEARYVGVGLAEISAGGGELRVYEFRLFDENDALIAHAEYLNEFDVALTKNGSSTASTVHRIVLPAEGGETIIGGSLSGYWNIAVSLEEFFDPNFGVMIRRSTGLTLDLDVIGPTRALSSRVIDFVGMSVDYATEGGSITEMERLYDLQKCIIGKENTPGTAVPPTIELRAAKFTLNPANRVQEFPLFGDLHDSRSVNHYRQSAGSIEGAPTYDELGIFLASVIGKPVSTEVATGVYDHEFVFISDAPANPQTYTVQCGDSDISEQVRYVILSSLGITTSGDSLSLSGSCFGRDVEERNTSGTPIGLSAGVNAVQTLTIGGTPTGGDYRLSFNGAVTSAIAYNASASAVQTALVALATVGSGNMSVSGSNGGPYTITAANALAGKELPRIEVYSNGLSGGTNAAPTVARTNKGGYTIFGCEPIGAGDIKVIYATSLAGLDDDANKLVDLYEFNLNIPERFQPQDTIDDARDSFKTAGDVAGMVKGTFKLKADAVGQVMAAAERAKSTVFTRFQATSKVQITSGYYFRLRIDMCTEIREVGSFDRSGTVYSRTFGWTAKRDTATGRVMRVTLRNNVASY